MSYPSFPMFLSRWLASKLKKLSWAIFMMINIHKFVEKWYILLNRWYCIIIQFLNLLFIENKKETVDHYIRFRDAFKTCIERSVRLVIIKTFTFLYQIIWIYAVCVLEHIFSTSLVLIESPNVSLLCAMPIRHVGSVPEKTKKIQKTEENQ